MGPGNVIAVRKASRAREACPPFPPVGSAAKSSVLAGGQQRRKTHHLGGRDASQRWPSSPHSFSTTHVLRSPWSGSLRAGVAVSTHLHARHLPGAGGTETPKTHSPPARRSSILLGGFGATSLPTLPVSKPLSSMELSLSSFKDSHIPPLQQQLLTLKCSRDPTHPVRHPLVLVCGATGKSASSL